MTHLLLGTRQGNKTEHRLFRGLRRTGRGRLLRRCETLVPCIARATTTTAPTIHAEYDAGPDLTGITVTDEEFPALHVTRDAFPGEGNHIIPP